MSDSMLLYHAGNIAIPEPDVHFGRKNADFGQGFYLTPSRDFACRWARERSNMDVVLNIYQLDTEGLSLHSFQRDEAWFDYIFHNRAGRADTLPHADVITGPIANDTIYETFGIITSGFLKREQAMQLLMIGPAYEQIALKTEKAARHLRFVSSEVLEPAHLRIYRETVKDEQDDYQKRFAEVLDSFY